MTRSQQSTAPPKLRTGGRFTIRNLGGVALFLFGTTYVWTTPAFGQALGPEPPVPVRNVGVDGPTGDALFTRPRES
jgi:hypothetical protein